MKKILIYGLCIFAFAACEKEELPIIVTDLRCGEQDVMVRVFDERIDAIIGDEIISMIQVSAASGAKYHSEITGLGLWNKGDSWIMTTRNTNINCYTKPYEKAV